MQVRADGDAAVAIRVPADALLDHEVPQPAIILLRQLLQRHAVPHGAVRYRAAEAMLRQPAGEGLRRGLAAAEGEAEGIGALAARQGIVALAAIQRVRAV